MMKMKGKTRAAWARMAFWAKGPGWYAGRADKDASVAGMQ
jgi:hypothetical protein